MNKQHEGYKEFCRVRSILNGTTPLMTAQLRPKPRTPRPVASASDQWQKLTESYVQTGMSKVDAIRQVVKDFPELRERFCKDMTEEAERRRKAAAAPTARRRQIKYQT